MKRFNLNSLTRGNISRLVPYSSARDEFYGTGATLLDANESPFNPPFNRYPDPLQRLLKTKISELFGIPENSMFLGNGSDEAIDLLIRAFCEPRIDNVLTIDPSYGMYEVCANINDIKIKKVLLNEDFTLNPDAVREEIDDQSKLIFLCSPNNPTSNLLDNKPVLEIVKYFKGLVIVDEAYIDFSGTEGLIRYLPAYPNLVIIRTFSKAWALAGLRLGIALAHPDVISILNKIKYPYNINMLTQKHIFDSINSKHDLKRWIDDIIEQRNWLAAELQKLDFVIKVYHSDANFLLVKTSDPLKIYAYLREHGLVVRDRSKVNLCEGCLRITIGTREENKKLLIALNEFE